MKLNPKGIINPRGLLKATCLLLMNSKPTFTNNYNIGSSEIAHNDFSHSSSHPGTLGPPESFPLLLGSIKQRAFLTPRLHCLCNDPVLTKPGSVHTRKFC